MPPGDNTIAVDKYIISYKSQQDAQVTEYIFVWELLYMFRVSLSPISGAQNNCNYSIW